MSFKKRVTNYFDLNTHLSTMSTRELAKLLKSTKTNEGWGQNQVVAIADKKVFVKRIPLTKVEYLPRRYFTDNKHFSLVLWYDSSDFKNIVGYQLSYRPVFINTDNEYFVTHYPDNPNTTHKKVATQKIDAEDRRFPASKLLQQTSEEFPLSFWENYSKALASLPDAIQSFLNYDISTDTKKIYK